MKKLPVYLLLLLNLAAAPLFAATFNVRDYGAVGDGKTLDTDAINRAIEAAAAAGGGTVEFPAGDYLSFSIHLKSHVTLFLDSGSTIIAAEPPEDLSYGYDAPEPNPDAEFYADFGHTHWRNSLIWGEDLVNIGIVGPGKIFGRGLSRGQGRRDVLPEEWAEMRASSDAPNRVRYPLPESAIAARAAQKNGPFGYPGHFTLPAGVGNKAIALKNCRNVIFRDFTIYHGGHFAILASGVDNWTLDGLKIDTNRDGIDIDCCQNVRVSNCTINAPYDDGLCLKSSYALGYPRITENITITNCQLSGFDEGTLLDGTRQRIVKKRGGTGRIKFGTEANGGFRNIAISNCVFENSRGIALEQVDGGVLEDVTITNITMRDLSNPPIYIRLGARLRGPEPIAVGSVRRIKIDNIIAYNAEVASGILIMGIPGHYIEDVSLSNIFTHHMGGGTAEQALRVVPDDKEAQKAYPEPMHHGVMPSWGMYARHVKNLDLHRVEFRVAKEDLRPVIHMEDVHDVTFDTVTLPPTPNAAKIVLKDVTGFSTRDFSDLPDADQEALIDNETL